MIVFLECDCNGLADSCVYVRTLAMDAVKTAREIQLVQNVSDAVTTFSA